MTNVYFVRHAKPDYLVHEDLIRPLTEEGIIDSKRVTDVLKDKNICKIYSSPYKRAMDTVKDLADTLKLNIIIKEDLRERTITDQWIEDFNSFVKSQWEDFDYKLSKGESLREVQQRNVQALMEILCENEGNNIVIGTHGTALSTIINYYDESFDFSQFNRIKGIMPWIVTIKFEGDKLMNIEEITFK